MNFSQRVSRNPAVSMGLLLITLTCSILFPPIVMLGNKAKLALVAADKLPLSSTGENSMRLHVELS